LARQKATHPELPDLPILDSIAELREALRAGHAVLSAEPGSGKTTLVPLLLLDEPWLRGRKILMLEPRRPAARMAARRMAVLRGETVGGTIGYQVRFERVVSPHTRVEVLTEGLLVRRLQSEPELADVGLVIFDEFHERNLQGDLSLALVLDICAGLRDDLRLLVMSATLEVGGLSTLLPARPVRAEGRRHPVQLVYAERDGELRDPVPACLRALGRALEACTGDILVFLPGRREIEQMHTQAKALWNDGLLVQPLYGDMPAAAQDAVLQGRADRRRVILATDIAETSLTIEGVEAVVDSGLARRPVFDASTGLTRLQTVWIDKASATQRAGRAGRLGPGRCYRAWSEARQGRLEDAAAPEIASADLVPLVLELANWGVTAADGLRWLDAPPEAHWRQAVELLQQLGALAEDGRVTPLGRRMARFPTHPRLAHVLAAAADSAQQQLAADLAAVLSERDPLRGVAGCGADVLLRLEALTALRARTGLPSGMDRNALQRIDRVARQLLQLCPRLPAAEGRPVDPGPALALAYPDRVAMCSSPDGRRYLMRNGRAALLGETDPLRGSPFLAVAGVDAGRRDGTIWLAAALEGAALEQLFGGQIASRREVRWDAGRGDVVARRVRRLGALLLADEAVPLQPDDPVVDVLLAQIRAQGIEAFFEDPHELHARVQLMRELDPQGDWPDLSAAALLAGLEDWLAPWLKPGQGVRQLRAIRLNEVFLNRLGWDRQRRLDDWLPAYFETPAGSRRHIEYDLDGAPVIRVPLQEMLGLSRGPTLAQGRVTPVLHLLSPAGRPLQVTTDLAAFWAGAYGEVKKEMRGRYPKHYWPDDPATAQATRFTKRRM